MKDFEFILTTNEGFDYFVTEIWHKNSLIAIVDEYGKIELFNPDENKEIIESNIFSTAIDIARKKLKDE